MNALGHHMFGVGVMRFFFTALSILLIASTTVASYAADDKKPKPVDIKKEINEKCGSAPYGLVELNGKTATKEEMEEAKFQVTAFITQVDVYQECLIKLANSLNERLSDNDKRILALAIKQSQEEKEAVGSAYNQAVDDFNKTHK
jgi:hypothetical protein